MNEDLVQLIHFLEKFGFETARCRFVLVTAVSAWSALALAWGLGLEASHWAAMSVYMVAQPNQGEVLEKGAFRIVGTAIGAQLGALLLFLGHNEPWRVVLGLTFSLSAIVVVGNALRHFTAHAVLLVGSTSAIIALQSIRYPAHVLDLDVARMLDMVIGIVIASTVALAFPTRTTRRSPQVRLAGLQADIFLWVADILGRPYHKEMRRRRFEIISDMAALEHSLDTVAAGSPQAHRQNGYVRMALSELLTVMSVANGLRRVPHEDDRMVGSWLYLRGTVAAAFRETAQDGACGDLSFQLEEAVVADRARGGMYELTAAIANLAQCLERLLNTAPAEPFRREVPLHRDWPAAWAAGMRVAVAVGGAGAIWIGTGWEFGALMLMGTAIFVTLFSTFDEPSQILRGVLLGGAAGAASAVVWRVGLLPWLGGSVVAVGSIAMVLAFACILMLHRRGAPYGLDFAMCFLLVARPAEPAGDTFVHVAGSAFALVLGVFAAYVAFIWLFPVTPRRRLAALSSQLIRDLERLVSCNRDQALKWKFRLYHRLMRLTYWANWRGADGAAEIDAGLAIVDIGRHALSLRRLSSEMSEAEAIVEIQEVLKALGYLGDGGDRVCESLRRSSERLRSRSGHERERTLVRILEIKRQIESCIFLKK